MKHWLKRIAITLAGVLVLGLSALSWYGFSAPPIHRLPLAHGLIDASSAEGLQWLAGSSARTDYDQLAPFFVTQRRRAFCGVASTTMLVNAILHPQPLLTQSALFTPAVSAVRSELAVTFGGLTLDQLAGVLRAHGLEVQVVHAAGSTLESFRNTARATLAEPREFLVVNFDRATLGEAGSGHISPLGAYSSAADRLLMLDVAANKYPYTWVPVEALWNAMNTLDPASGLSRGFVLVRAGAAAPAVEGSRP